MVTNVTLITNLIRYYCFIVSGVPKAMKEGSLLANSRSEVIEDLIINGDESVLSFAGSSQAPSQTIAIVMSIIMVILMATLILFSNRFDSSSSEASPVSQVEPALTD
jgi:hypothetical protein